MNKKVAHTHLLFPVEAPGVTVGYIDVAVRLEDCQLKAPQHAVEQLAAGRLKAAMQRSVSEKKPTLFQRQLKRLDRRKSSPHVKVNRRASVLQHHS